MRRLLRAFVVGAGTVSGFLILAICAVMMTEIVARYLFNRPTYWALEVVSYCVVWSACLGSAYTLRFKGHIAVDVLVEKLPESLKHSFERLCFVVIALFAFILVKYGFDQAMHAYKIKEISLTPLAMPQWIPLLSIPIGGLLLLLQSIEFVFYPHEFEISEAGLVD